MPDVLAADPGARFVWVGGDGEVNGRSSRELLLERMRAAGVADHAEFVGAVPHAATAQYYQASTVCVFPSTWEVFGLVAAEAMACGKPVVGSTAGGMSEIIEDGVSGRLVAPGDPRA